MKRTYKIIAPLLLLSLILQSALACPFCLAPMQTWSEMVAESDVVCLAKLLSVSDGTSADSSFSMLEITSIHKGKELLGRKQIRIDEHFYGKPGDLFLLKGSMQDSSPVKLVETFATDSDGKQLTTESKTQPESKIQTVSATKPAMTSSLKWDFIEKVSEASYRYITEAPAPDADPIKKLTYFLAFLEHSDPLIAADAWGEFANSKYEDIVAIRSQLPREKLRTWIAQKDTSPERLGLFGMLLGLCGNDNDAEFLRQQINQGSGDDIRFGVEGLMGGLLLLSGEDGLQFIEESRMQNPEASALESLAIVHALQFVWTYESELIPKERLRKSLHPMLANEAVREIAITDLSRWNDWSLVSKLEQIYTTSHEDDPGSTRAIVGYLTTCQKSDAATAEQVAQAAALLDRIRQEQPRLVRMVETSLRYSNGE